MSLELYPEIILDKDLSPDAFGSETDDACKAIKEACEGWGTNEKKLIEVLGSKDAEERYKISLRFPELNDGKSLKDLMKSENSGDFGLATQYLALPLDEAEAAMLKRAVKGLGANKGMIYPIVCGRTNNEIDILKKTYFRVYTQDLGRTLDSELGGDFEKLIFTCLQGAEEEYDPDYHTEEKAKEDVEAIYNAGQGKWGTDEQGLFKVLCASPAEHLKKVNMLYADKHGYTLMKVLEKEMGGDLQKGSLFMLGMKTKPSETIAKLIKSACAGFGTDELLLTCTLIRYQKVLKDAEVAHVDLFGKTICDRIQSETGGSYRDVLLAIAGTAGLS
eukprot:CAMPEP_0118715030 /NCGR_PEP_ID=MMETSP0800-20121206/26608_1 /TAXON_ID=210618 ORGANISM="Striatella unipunctata, Strain CCMP2910" /NCGR_SAMPLE_ID=MMETSP0800 /ASSEMBLY_ACC=CAM_ASM_000638 /LENGTH=331 /DNA_ID=CAMNT_0006621073 /DNA_START=33 /DNA_END=1028 /DNA_ORIENTATION=+